MASAAVLAPIYDDFGPHSRVRSRTSERRHPNIPRTPKVRSNPPRRIITAEELLTSPVFRNPNRPIPPLPRSPPSIPTRSRSQRSSSNQNRVPDQPSQSRNGSSRNGSSRRNTSPELPPFEVLFPSHSSPSSMRSGEYARMMRGAHIGPYSKRGSPNMRRASCPELHSFWAMDVDAPTPIPTPTNTECAQGSTSFVTRLIESTRAEARFEAPVGYLSLKFQKMRL